MRLNARADVPSGSAGPAATVGAIRDIVARILVTALMGLAAVVVDAEYAFAVQGGRPDGGASSPRPGRSAQAVTERATKPARTDARTVPGSDLRVQWKAGKLSLDAERAPLSEVLGAVSRATGIRVSGAQGLSNRVSAHFTEMNLLPALRQLLARVDHVVAAGPEASSPAQGTRVIIFLRAAEGGPPTSVVPAETSAQEAAEAVLQQSEAILHEEPEGDPPVSQLEALQAAADEVADGGPSMSLDAGETDAPEAPEAVRQQSEATLHEEPPADPQEGLRAALQAAATDGDWDSVRNFLQDADPTIQSAAFQALAAQDKPVAVEELWAHVQDTSQPTRLQALALLVQNSGADEQTVTEALGEALHDPDPALNAYAVQILAGRDDTESMAALRRGLDSPDPSARLMILESVVHTEAGLPLLREALADSDETVRDAAATLLEQAEAVSGTTGNP